MVLDLTTLENNTAIEFSLHDNENNPKGSRVNDFGVMFHNTFGNDAFQSLISTLPSGSLETNYDEYPRLIKALKRCTVLESFTIDLDRISSKDAERLAEALTSRPRLYKLILRSGWVSDFKEDLDKSLKILLAAFKGHPNLKELYLDYSLHPPHIYDYDFSTMTPIKGSFTLVLPILDILESNGALEIIKVSLNMGNEYAISFARALKNNTTLKFLDLSYNNFDDAIADEFYRNLKDNSTLQELNLRNNKKISAQGAKDFKKLLMANDALLGLYIFDVMSEEPKQWVTIAKELLALTEYNRHQNPTVPLLLQYVTETMKNSLNAIPTHLKPGELNPVNKFLCEALPAKIRDIDSYNGKNDVMEQVIACLNMAAQNAKGFYRGRFRGIPNTKEINFIFFIAYQSSGAGSALTLKIKPSDDLSVSADLPQKELSLLKINDTTNAYQWLIQQRNQIFSFRCQMITLQSKFNLQKGQDTLELESYMISAGDDYVWRPCLVQLLQENGFSPVKTEAATNNRGYLDLPPIITTPMNTARYIAPLPPPVVEPSSVRPVFLRSEEVSYEPVRNAPLTYSIPEQTTSTVEPMDYQIYAPAAVASPYSMHSQLPQLPPLSSATAVAAYVPPPVASSFPMYSQPPVLPPVSMPAAPIIEAYVQPPVASSFSMGAQFPYLPPVDTPSVPAPVFYPPIPAPVLDDNDKNVETTTKRRSENKRDKSSKSVADVGQLSLTETPYLTDEQVRMLAHLHTLFPTLISQTEKLKKAERLQADLELVAAHPSVLRVFTELSNQISNWYFSAKVIVSEQVQVVSNETFYWILEQMTSGAATATSSILPVSLLFTALNKGVTFLKEEEVKLKAQYLVGLIEEHKKEKLLVELPLYLALAFAEEISKKDIHASSQLGFAVAGKLPNIARKKLTPNSELDDFIEKVALNIAEGWSLAGKKYQDLVFESKGPDGTFTNVQKWQAKWLKLVLKFILEIKDKTQGDVLLTQRLESGRQWLKSLQASATTLPVETAPTIIPPASEQSMETRIKKMEQTLNTFVSTFPKERGSRSYTNAHDIPVDMNDGTMMLVAKVEQNLHVSSSRNTQDDSVAVLSKRLAQLEQLMALVAEIHGISLPLQEVEDQKLRGELFKPAVNSGAGPSIS